MSPDNDVMLMALLSLRGRAKSREEYEAAVAALQVGSTGDDSDSSPLTESELRDALDSE